MGKAIILSDSDFTAYNLGQCHRLIDAILPSVTRITSATTFRVVKNNIQLTGVSWAISNSTLASLVINADGTCTVTPLTATMSSVMLTATYVGGELSTSFIATKDFLDITSLLSASFLSRRSLGSFTVLQNTANTKRCCVQATSFSSIGVDISQYSTIEVIVKNGYDYVFGTGPAISSNDGWQGWNGSTGGQEFNWITGNQKGIAAIDASVLAMSLNLRYDDNTTEFSASANLTDIVESIILIP